MLPLSVKFECSGSSSECRHSEPKLDCRVPGNQVALLDDNEFEQYRFILFKYTMPVKFIDT